MKTSSMVRNIGFLLSTSCGDRGSYFYFNGALKNYQYRSSTCVGYRDLIVCGDYIRSQVLVFLGGDLSLKRCGVSPGDSRVLYGWFNSAGPSSCLCA